MITANELRIGNKFIGIAGVQTVFDISDNTNRNTLEYASDKHKEMYSHLITVEENLNQYKPCEIEGIELTEDILLRCPNFAKVYCDELEYINYQGSGIYDIYTGDKNGFLEVVISLDDRELKRISVLHELQNWIFLLTGEELTINL